MTISLNSIRSSVEIKSRMKKTDYSTKIVKIIQLSILPADSKN